MVVTRCRVVCALFLLASLLLSSALIAWSLPIGSDASDLLGCTPVQVMERLGPPVSIGFGAADFCFYYAEQRQSTEPDIRFCGDCAYWVRPGLQLPARPGAIPATGAYPGQSLREMVARIGQPDSVSHGSTSILLRYDDGLAVDSARGMVCSVERE